MTDLTEVNQISFGYVQHANTWHNKNELELVQIK